MAIVFSVYGNTLNHDYNLDDSYYVNILPKVDAKPNEIVKVVTKRFSKSDYRPIPALHLAIEQYCFGQKSSVFHFFNVFYYALLGIAIFILFNQLKIFPNQWMVLLLVILFLVHPSHSNVVASIKNRDVILSMFYGVLAIICFVRFYDVKKYLYLLSSALLLLIAILCKRDALMFLFIALGVVHFSRSINWRKALIPVAVSFFLVVSLYVLSTFFIADKVVEASVTDFFENPLVENVDIAHNIALKLYLVNYYHKFMVIPTGYYFYFGYNQIPIPNILSLKVIVSVVLHLLVFFIGLYFLRKGRKDNLLLGALIYFSFLMPLLLFLNSTAGIVAVRYSFNASLGFAIMVTSVMIYGYNSKKSIFQLISKVVAVVIIAISIFFTVDRNKDWKDKEALFRHDLESLEHSYMANKMGGIYFGFLEEQETNPNKKMEYLSQSSKYLMRAKSIYDKDPLLWQNLGLLNMKQEDYKQGYFSFKEAIKLDSTNTQSWNYYGNFCEFAKDLERAERAYRKIVALEPTNPLGYKNLTFVLLNQQKIEEAININRKMLSDDEMKKYGWENLGHIFLAVKDTANAIQNFNHAFDAGLENELLKRDISKLSKTFKP